MKYPGIVRDELFYKYFTKVKERTIDSPVGPNKVEDYIFNIKALYDDLGYTQKINQLNEKYKNKGINLVIPESDQIDPIYENSDGYGLPRFAKEKIYGAIFKGTYLYGEQIIDPEELMSLNSLQNSSIKSIMPNPYSKNTNYPSNIKTVDQLINNIDYKKIVHEASTNFEFLISTKKTERDLLTDSSNADLDTDSAKSNKEHAKKQEEIINELKEKYSSKIEILTTYIYSPKSETANMPYDYSDPNYEGI